MTRRFGVELEFMLEPYFLLGGLKAAGEATGHGCVDQFKCGEAKRHLNYWVLKPDGSVVSEINTPILSDLGDLRKGIDALVGTLGDDFFCIGRIAVNPRCGLHVHVEAQDLKTDLLSAARSVPFLANGEPWLQSLQPKHRTDNHYCSSIMSDIHHYQSFGKKGGEKYLKNHRSPKNCLSYFVYNFLGECGIYRARNKHSSITLDTLGRHGTVEVRIGAGSTDVDQIVNWTDLCCRFVDRCASAAAPSRRKKPAIFPDLDAFLRFCGADQDLCEWAHKRYKVLHRSRAA